MFLRTNALNAYGYGGVFSEIAEKVSEKATPVVSIVVPIFMGIQYAAIAVTNNARSALSPSSLKEMSYNAAVNITQRLPTVARQVYTTITTLPHLSPKKILNDIANDKKEVIKAAKEEMVTSFALFYTEYSRAIYMNKIGVDYTAKFTDGYINGDHASVVFFLNYFPIRRAILNENELERTYRMLVLEENYIRTSILDLLYYNDILAAGCLLPCLLNLGYAYTEISKPILTLLYYMPSLLLSKNTPEVMTTVTQAITSFVHVSAYVEFGLPGILVTGLAIGLINGIAKQQELDEHELSVSKKDQ